MKKTLKKQMLKYMENYFTFFHLELGLDSNKTKTCVSSNTEWFSPPTFQNTLLPILQSNETYKYLGIHITLNLDWQKQEAISIGMLNTQLEYIKNRCLSIAQPLIQIINQVFIPAIEYRMNVIKFSTHFLDTCQKNDNQLYIQAFKN